jgi:hypothetical protein
MLSIRSKMKTSPTATLRERFFILTSTICLGSLILEAIYGFFILRNRNFKIHLRGTRYRFSCRYLLRLESDGTKTDYRTAAKVLAYFRDASTK